MKTFKDILSEDVYLVKMSNKDGKTMVRQYRGKSEMDVSSKAKVDAKIRGFSVDSVRLMSKEKEEVDEAFVASADYKVSPSGRKVHKMKKVNDEPEDEDDEEKKDVKEELNKSDVPAYLRKKTGDKLTTQDLEKERTKNRSHPETIKKINGVQQEGAVPAHMQGKQKPYVSSDGKGNYEVLGNRGQTKATFSRKEHGKDAHVKAQAHLRSKYDEYMKEEVEELDEVLDMRHHTTGTGSIHVSHTHTSPSRVHSIGYTDAHKISNLKAGEKHEYKNANGHETFTAHKQSDGSTKIHDNRGTHVATIKNKMGKYDGPVKESIEEAVDKQEQRFLQLARLGLVDKSDVSKLRIALDQLKADKPLTVPQRTMLLGVMSDLISLVTGDDTIFNRVKMDVQKESVEDLDENTEALKKKADASGVSLSTLKTVYKRGVAAWNSGHRPGTTPQQWGMARVNSYITKGKTYHTADKDLREGGEPEAFDVQDIDEACWDTHKQVGMKKKGDKMVPNCVPKEEVQEDSRLDNKAYHKGVSDKTAQARVAHWKKMDKLSDNNPKAYTPAPGDATAETKPSKHTKKYHAMYGEDVEIVEEESIVLEEGYVSLAQQRAVWATRKDGGKGHPDNKNKEKKEETIPFDGPYTKTKGTTTDKSGAKHSPMSAARHLARLALQKQQQKQQQKKLKEECDDCYEEIIEDFEVGGEQYLDEGIDELFEEIEYQGRKVTLNKPFAGDGKKKRYVYVKNEKGNVVKVGFGDPNMEIRRDDPERRSNFRARHNCDTPGPKWKARYWSCKYWSTTPVSKM